MPRLKSCAAGRPKILKFRRLPFAFTDMLGLTGVLPQKKKRPWVTNVRARPPDRLNRPWKAQFSETLCTWMPAVLHMQLLMPQIEPKSAVFIMLQQVPMPENPTFLCTMQLWLCVWFACLDMLHLLSAVLATEMIPLLTWKLTSTSSARLPQWNAPP